MTSAISVKDRLKNFAVASGKTFLVDESLLAMKMICRLLRLQRSLVFRKMRLGLFLRMRD